MDTPQMVGILIVGFTKGIMVRCSKYLKTTGMRLQSFLLVLVGSSYWQIPENEQLSFQIFALNKNAYDIVNGISFEGKTYRTDIATKGVARLKKETV